MKNFFRKNWLYIILFSFLILINVFPGSEKKIEEKPEIKVAQEEKATLFVDFNEAEERSKKIEEALKGNLPKYLFYLSFNLLLIFIFLLGLAINGYFIYCKIKRKQIFKKLDTTNLPPWNIGEIFKIIILAFSFGYLFFMVVGFLAGIVQSVTKTELPFGDSENFQMIISTIVLDAMVFIVILRFLWDKHRRKLSDLGFSKKDLSRNIFYGVFGYIGIIPVILMIGVVVYFIISMFKIIPPAQPIVDLLLNEKSTALLLLSSIIASIFGPLVEEIFFRGVMYNAIKRKIGVFWGIVITSVLFSFLHTHALEYFLVGFIPIVVLGVVLAYLYEKTGSLIPSFTLHVLNNLGSVIMVFAFKYFNSLLN